MTPPVYELAYGDQTIALLPDVLVRFRVWRDEMHVDHVMVVVNDRHAGDFSGTVERCEVWVAGWISGRLGARLT